jgi:hypothetical protein
LAAADYLIPDLTGVEVSILPGDAGLQLNFTTLAA